MGQETMVAEMETGMAAAMEMVAETAMLATKAVTAAAKETVAKAAMADPWAAGPVLAVVRPEGMPALAAATAMAAAKETRMMAALVA
ncbi:hypothetical protein ILT44_15160 [Microvirga sp. BT689]|uniref:hypothetical protein n=1 Tax=Microvirga arvi TaxID=2778731 RepID=UPI00194FDC6E|nr:hypothetical protein [Microvirga arvi]MBM6581534.1 hypothetical protein [Microvirga arvi]